MWRPETTVVHDRPLAGARRSVLSIFFITGMAGAVWISRIPSVKHRLDLTNTTLGLVLLAAPIGLILALTVAGRLVDRFGSVAINRLSVPIFTLLLVAPGLARDAESLAVALFVTGIFGGVADIAMNAHALSVERRSGRPLMSSFHAAYSFGGLAGAVIGTLSASHDMSPALTFAITAVVLTLIAIPVVSSLRRGPDPTSAQAQAQADPSGVPAKLGGRIMLLGALALFCQLSEGAARDWSGVYLHDSVGASTAFAAGGYAAFSITMACGRLFGDRLAARLGPVRLVRVSSIIAGLGLCGGLLSRRPVGGAVGFGLFGAGLSCVVPQVFTAVGNADPSRAGRNLARVAGFSYAGVLCGPPLIGGLAGLSGLAAALGILVLLILGVAVFADAARPVRR